MFNFVEGAVLIGIIIITILFILMLSMTLAFIYTWVVDWRAKKAFEKRQEDYKKRI